MSYDHDQQVKLQCVNNGKIMDADIIRWSKNKFLVVALNTIKINLQYNQKLNMYVGKSAGLNFQTSGPI